MCSGNNHVQLNQGHTLLCNSTGYGTRVLKIDHPVSENSGSIGSWELHVLLSFEGVYVFLVESPCNDIHVTTS